MATMHTAMKTMLKANNSVRHLPLAQLEGLAARRALRELFAQHLRKRLTELLAHKNGTKMNLQPQAENESRAQNAQQIGSAPRSHLRFAPQALDLSPDCQVAQRARRSITFTSVYRFCERAIARRPRNSSPLEVEQAAPIFTPTPQPTTTKPTNQYRFNLEI